jgi:predicted acyltransferase
MVGMAMPFSLGRRLAAGDSPARVFQHVAWRALILIVLSNIYSNWGEQPGALKFQLINVLCQIAFGYLLCSLIMQLRFTAQVAVAVALLAGHWVLFVAFPGPGGAWSQTGNIGAVIDLKVLGYNYSGYYTTINFIGNAVTILFGCWAGLLVKTTKTHAEKLKILIGCAAAALVLGLALQPVNPMVKRLWTCSFTFFSAGWVLLMLAVFYWLIEVKQVRRGTLPFLVLGTNSIFVYSLGQIGISGWLNRGLASFTGNFAFLGEQGAIPQRALVLFCLWYLCYWLYQRKIFFKI